MTALVSATDVSIEFPIRKADQIAGSREGSGRPAKTSHTALKNANFEWVTGDRIGIRGPNGAGKTTLLKLLAGIYAPSQGTLAVSGKIVALTDIFMGFDSSADAIQNIRLRGRLLGATPDQIQVAMPEICDFSGLGEFLYLPMRTYSSGMLMRLAFSVTAFMPFDILLMDEWLSVGDAAFNTKVEQKLESMVDSAKIFVLASHATNLLDRVCNQQYELNGGQLTRLQQ
jgi:lipopolysaccharide transport system ATP-binding protein